MRDASSWKLLKRLSLRAVAMTPDDRRSTLVTLTRNGRSVTVLDGRTGKVLRSTPLPGGRAGWRVAADKATGHVFVMGRAPYGSAGSPRGGWVMTVDTAAGHVLRTVRVGSNTHVGAVDSKAAHALVPSDWTTKSGVFGEVSLIDTRTGALVRNTPLLTANLVSALTIDTRTSRAFTLGAGPGRSGSRPSLADMQKAANSVAVLNSRTGALLRVVDLSAG